MLLLQQWDKPMYYSDQAMGDAKAKEALFKNFFGAVKAMLRDVWHGRDRGESQVPGPVRLPRHPLTPCIPAPLPEAGRTRPPCPPSGLLVLLCRSPGAPPCGESSLSNRLRRRGGGGGGSDWESVLHDCSPVPGGATQCRLPPAQVWPARPWLPGLGNGSSHCRAGPKAVLNRFITGSERALIRR